MNDLKIGDIYVLELVDGSSWLFEKSTTSRASDRITSTCCCVCLDDGYTYRHSGVVCTDDRIRHIRFPNKNHIAIWNRTFPDNIKCLW